MAAFFIAALRCGGVSVGANTSHYNRERHSVSGRWHPRCGNIADLLAGLYQASGQAVAAGTKSATLGAAGALSVALVPTASATPANTVYTVVYQLDDRTVKTEFWSVPTTSPTTVAAVRTILGSAGSANPPVTKQYVDAALASKADDSA